MIISLHSTQDKNENYTVNKFRASGYFCEFIHKRLVLYAQFFTMKHEIIDSNAIYQFTVIQIYSNN